MKRQLVLACGNTLRGDDGVGWQIAEALERDASLTGVDVIVSQQLTPELAEPISGADTVIFVDCSAIILPGKVSVFPVDPSQTMIESLTHSTSPSRLLALAGEVFGSCPRRAFAVTVGGNSFQLAEELTEPVRLAIPEAVRAIRQLLSSKSQ